MPGYAKEILRKYKKGGKVDKKKKDYSYAEGGKVEVTPEAKKIPKELEKASKMHKGQAERLKGMGFKDGGEMKYGHGGEAKPDFLDMDKDGDKKESMKQAVKNKKMKKMKHGGMVMKIVKKLKDKK
jgi:predicted ATPase